MNRIFTDQYSGGHIRDIASGVSVIHNPVSEQPGISEITPQSNLNH